MSQRARSTPAGLPTASLTGEKGLIMKLSVMERLTVQGLLPQEANFTNLKLLRIARENLSFSEKELKILNVREGSEPGTIQWDEGVVSESDIELGETATGMIIDALKKLDGENKLTNNHFSLYEKFVESKTG